MKCIECRGVTRTFGAGARKRVALHDCSFVADPGEIVGVVGPNGAGKTTLLRLVAGEILPTAGDVLVLGRRAATRSARRVVGFASDPPLTPAELTCLEWLSYLASHRAGSRQERARLVTWAVGFAEVSDFAGRRIGTLSRGMHQRLALAAAAVAGSAALVLDETLSGVDPLVQRRLRFQIARLAATGRLILIASHDLGALERLATRVLVLCGGRVRADERMADLMAQRVAELTLSGSSLASVDRVLQRFTGAVRTGHGVAVPLRCGATVEQVLAACGEERIPVAASRVRYRALEDILVAAAGGEEGLA